jgi:hypothetical protein
VVFIVEYEGWFDVLHCVLGGVDRGPEFIYNAGVHNLYTVLLDEFSLQIFLSCHINETHNQLLVLSRIAIVLNGL